MLNQTFFVNVRPWHFGPEFAQILVQRISTPVGFLLELNSLVKNSEVCAQAPAIWNRKCTQEAINCKLTV
jgi:hypothetical protein